MSVQDDKSADQQDDKSTDQDDKHQDDRQSSRAAEADQTNQGDDEQKLTEKPEPDDDDKKEAAKMMEAYKDKPTIVLPGTGGSVSGTAVNDWLDEDGNPRHEEPEGGDSGESSQAQTEGDEGRDEQALKDQIEKDKELNKVLKEAAAAENKGEKD
ncbi:hypothetical protein [Mycobacterium colombiense]|uniref:hypothetical protein n=1 Tax=Mycobacterium colombiense TaxID=339268 RepID=UPI0026C38A71